MNQTVWGCLCYEKYSSNGDVMALCLSNDVFVRNSNDMIVWKTRAQMFVFLQVEGDWHGNRNNVCAVR
jgi:hypothetical protein